MFLSMKAFRRTLLLLSLVIIMVGCLLVWGDSLLMVAEPLPRHVDVVVALQGSIRAERARIAGSMDFYVVESPSALC